MHPVSMENLLGYWFHKLVSCYIFLTATVRENILNPLLNINCHPVFFPLLDLILSVYFRYCHLSPSTVDLDDQTTVHFWTPTHRRFNKPNLVLIHGFGGNSKFQFSLQLLPLARSFNLYIPDLLFFGKSYSHCPDRTVAFQAKCFSEGLRRLGVDRYSVYGVSYGGFVAYRMAARSPDAVDKAVLLGSGLVCTPDQREEQLRFIGRHVPDLLVAEKPDDLRYLANLFFCRSNFVKWVPDFFVRDYIAVICNTNRKQKREVVEHLLATIADGNVPILEQDERQEKGHLHTYV